MTKDVPPDRLNVLSYWGPRDISSNEAAECLTLSLRQLSAVSSDLAAWYEVASSWQQARSRPVPLDPDEIERTFQFDDPVLNEALSGVIQNGFAPATQGTSATLTFTMGAGKPDRAMIFPNHVLLKLAQLQSGSIGSNWPQELFSVVDVLIGSLKPDHLFVGQSWMRQLTYPRRMERLGWITYIRLPTANPPADAALPAPIVAKRLSANELMVQVGEAASEVTEDLLMTAQAHLSKTGWLLEQPLP